MEKEKTFFGKILGDLFDFFKSNWEKFFKKTWNNSVPEPIKEKVTAIVKMVQLAKQMVDSDIADIVTAIIPGDWDDKIKDYLRKKLPVYLEKYKDLTDPDNAHNLATNLTKDVTGFSYGQSAVTVQMGYENYQANLPQTT